MLEPKEVTVGVGAGGTRRARDYRGLQAETHITEISVDRIFMGPCPNSRIKDMRLAEDVVKGKKIASKMIPLSANDL